MLNSRSAFALLSAVLLLALPACDSGSSESDAPSIEGEWQSDVRIVDGNDALKLRFDFDQDGSDISGNGTSISNEQGGAATPVANGFSVDGTYNHPDLSLNLNASGETESIDCVVINDALIECELAGDGETIQMQLKKRSGSDDSPSVEGSWRSEENEDFAFEIEQNGNELSGETEVYTTEGAYYSPILGVTLSPSDSEALALELDCIVESESAMECDVREANVGGADPIAEDMMFAREQ